MRTNRRKFIKKGFWAFLGTLIAPKLFFQSESYAASSNKLNYKPKPDSWSDNDINIAWIGHSTILMNIYGKWIITDPVLFERIGLYFFGSSIGPSRLTPPALQIHEIPKPDIILLSHAHMDHMDYPTLSKLTEMFPNQIDVITAFLTKDVIFDLEWKSITVMDWNDELTLKGINFKALEVKHFGWRFPWEKDRSRGYFKDGRSYNAYLIESNGSKILFGGDTSMTDKLNVIKNQDVDVALMPIGAYNPWRWNHCNPEEALKIASKINAKNFIPMHCNTFQQGREPFNEPLEWLQKSAPAYSINIAINEIGQTFTLS